MRLLSIPEVASSVFICNGAFYTCVCVHGARACVMVDTVVLPLENGHLEELCDLWACGEYHREHPRLGPAVFRKPGIQPASAAFAEKEEFGSHPRAPRHALWLLTVSPPQRSELFSTNVQDMRAHRTVRKESPASLMPESALSMELSPGLKSRRETEN